MQKKSIEYFINENGCHICTSHRKDSKGYPNMWYKGKHVSVYRYVYEQYNQCSILKRCGTECIQIRHECDNPACINPLHLLEGTSHDNHMDMVKRGRCNNARPDGVNYRKKKLTWENVRFIRENIRITGTKLAEMFNVSDTTIYEIRLNERYKI
ncbi:MAG TPA: hypothetical protein VIK78_14480 [Ruminiclostridium sp.]